MFKLSKQTCVPSGFNQHIERHGKIDKYAALDLTMIAEMHNSVLDMLAPGLRAQWFKPKPKSEEDLADQGTDDNLVCLRFPELQSTFTWDYKGAGYKCFFDFGISGDADINLVDMKLHKMKVEGKNGGTVKIEFKLSGKPSRDDIVPLYFMQEMQKVTLTLEPPEFGDSPQMDIEELEDDEI